MGNQLKRIRFSPEGQIFYVVEETENTVVYRNWYTRNPRNFGKVNKKYVTFI